MVDCCRLLIIEVDICSEREHFNGDINIFQKGWFVMPVYHNSYAWISFYGKAIKGVLLNVDGADAVDGGAVCADLLIMRRRGIRLLDSELRYGENDVARRPVAVRHPSF